MRAYFLSTFALRDVAHFTLNDLVSVRLENTADELCLAPQTTPGLERQMHGATHGCFAKLPQGLQDAFLIFEQPNIP